MRFSVLDDPYGLRSSGAAADCLDAASAFDALDVDVRRRSQVWDWETEVRRRRGGNVEHRLIVSPGAVRLSTGRGRGWQADQVDPAELARLQRKLERIEAAIDTIDVRLFHDKAHWTGEWDYFDERQRLTDRLAAVRIELGVAERKRGRSRCIEWSRKSKARMTRTLACLDYAPMTPTAELAPAMMTLTYPGDYLAVAPTWEASKAHLQRFRKRLERKYGPQAAVWKLESQRRGAPHYHLFVMAPAPLVELDGRVRQNPAVKAYREWCRTEWADIVGATGLDRARHELAGVNVDYHEGARMSDPQRIAVYFSSHGAKSSTGAKAYQNEVPKGWIDDDGNGGVGRFWGYWRLSKIEAEVIVDELDAIETQRLLRGWVRAQQRTAVREVVRDTRPAASKGRRLVESTGELVRPSKRKLRRRWTVRALHGVRPSGFVLANNGPELARAIGRALTDPPDWPAGYRRSLP